MLLEALRLPPARELAPALYIITEFGFFFLLFPLSVRILNQKKKPVSKRCEVVLMLSVCHLEREIFFFFFHLF